MREPVPVRLVRGVVAAALLSAGFAVLLGLPGCVEGDAPAPVAPAADGAPPTDPAPADSAADATLPAPADAAPSTDAAADPPAAADHPSDDGAGAEPVSDPPADDPAPPSEGAGAGDPAAPAPAAREELFVGWEQPRVALFLTGRQDGYIEPCGCTGLANQKGGLARRQTLLAELRDRGWEVVPLDVGNQVRRIGRQSEIKFARTADALRQLGYRAVAYGPDDLRLSSGELVAAAAGDSGNPDLFLGANVAVLDRALTPAFQVIEAGGLKIGVTAVLGESRQEGLQNEEVLIEPVLASLEAAWPELEAAECDLYVLLAQSSLEETRELARRFPQFQLVVTAGADGEPTREPERIEDSPAAIVQTGNKGMYAGVVGFFPGADTPLRYQRVPLDARFADGREMLDLLHAYQRQLESVGLEGLGVRPLPHPSGKTFVGSAACKKCHRAAYEVWETSLHAHGLDSLTTPGERSEIPRHFDPECLSCHVTGWNPQKYYPYDSGYLSLEGTPLVHHVGCENCHGPGSEHVAIQSGKKRVEKEVREAEQAAMRLPLDRAETHCMECHDLDNSPDFHARGAFEEFWSQIEH